MTQWSTLTNSGYNTFPEPTESRVLLVFSVLEFTYASSACHIMKKWVSDALIEIR